MVDKKCGLINYLSFQLMNSFFKDMIGQSPQDFLIRYRMSKATSLLTSTSLSIGDISVQVGYPNQLHFSRAFRNIYGMSPRQYRQQNKLLS